MSDQDLKLLLPLLASAFTAHPWHGVPIGSAAPNIVTVYVEITPSDTIKYELDKQSGLLRVDRPQKFSNYCPALYGFLPQTYCGPKVGQFCCSKTGRTHIVGDNDPLDICILSEKPILHSHILLQAIPIGGFRAIDGNQADDKIIAVLKEDHIYGGITDITECPENLIDRLRHYFLTYKDHPEQTTPQQITIAGVYGRQEAHQVIGFAMEDYQNKYPEVVKIFNQTQTSV